uniref:Uncharacterized protein n=1 Tax=Arundo donax TaxID=35708 RepID=A0A0A9EGL7_ARUDO
MVSRMVTECPQAGLSDSGAHTWTSQRPPATRASTRAARPGDRIPPAQVSRTTGLVGAPSPAGESEASAAGATPSASAVEAVLTSSAGGGRRAASTDWRLETSADGRWLRFGASSPEFASIGFASEEGVGDGGREGGVRR